MENQNIKQIVNDSKNIYLITSEEPEALASTMALFYTLRNLGKNVNLLLESLPENLKFLTPSLDNFISYPKNFVISIPNQVAKISQIYYEKNDQALKVHLSIDSGNIKKDNVSFYFSEAKPDLIITIGIRDFVKEMENKLDSFGFLLDSPILNIDNVKNNRNFGKINLVEEKSLAEMVVGLTENQSKDSALCLLAGIIIYTQGFKNKVTADVLQLASTLMKAGANLKIVLDNIK